MIDQTKLMTMGMRLGVGTSLRYLSKNRKSVSRLMTQRTYQPDQLLRPLADDLDALGIAGCTCSASTRSRRPRSGGTAHWAAELAGPARDRRRPLCEHGA